MINDDHQVWVNVLLQFVLYYVCQSLVFFDCQLFLFLFSVNSLALKTPLIRIFHNHLHVHTFLYLTGCIFRYISNTQSCLMTPRSRSSVPVCCWTIQTVHQTTIMSRLFVRSPYMVILPYLCLLAPHLDGAVPLKTCATPPTCLVIGYRQRVRRGHGVVLQVSS